MQSFKIMLNLNHANKNMWISGVPEGEGRRREAEEGGGGF